MPDRNSSPRRPSWLLLAGFGLMLVFGIGLMFAKATPSTPPPQPAAVPHFINLSADTPRIVVVAPADQILPGTSHPVGMLMSNLYRGQLPSTPTTGVVLSDSNCEPDSNGISHCLNEINLDGHVITVQHHHDMQRVPCLTPGETVQLMTFEAYRFGF